ncbi:MAG: hypothetical protein ACFNXX_09340, partial [Veillonella parvula]
MIDTFEKTYTDWSIDVGEYKYEGITLNEVELRSLNHVFDFRYGHRVNSRGDATRDSGYTLHVIQPLL